MENLSKKYAAVQMHLIHLEKAEDDYENTSEQTADDAQPLIHLFSDTFNSFCNFIADYLAVHHKGFKTNGTPKEIIENAHKAAFLADHDAKTLLQALKEKDATYATKDAEIPLIHTIDTYRKTMQTILSEIKP